jgi:hypothetical protein
MLAKSQQQGSILIGWEEFELLFSSPLQPFTDIFYFLIKNRVTAILLCFCFIFFAFEEKAVLVAAAVAAVVVIRLFFFFFFLFVFSRSSHSIDKPVHQGLTYTTS